MQVQKIMLFTSHATNSNAKANNSKSSYMGSSKGVQLKDSVNFTSKRLAPKQIWCPNEFLDSANKLVEKLKIKEKKVDAAYDVIENCKSTPEEIIDAEKIVENGSKIKKTVDFAQKKQNCEAELGHYYKRWELNLDTQQKDGFTRYRIALNSDRNAEEKSTILKQSLDSSKCPKGGFEGIHRKDINNIEAILDNFANAE